MAANLTKKSLRGWEFYGGSAKEDIEDNIDILRQRSRDAYMGIPTASAALKTMRTNVIAGGLMPAPQIDAEFLGLTPEDAEKLQAQIVREFALWADTPVCDADRVDNFYKLQQLTFLSYANGFVDELVDDGEKTVVENRGGLLFVNSVNMNLPFDKAPKFVQNSVAAAPAASGFVNTQTPAEQPGNNSHKEDTNMANEIKTVDELRGAYPALVDQIEQAAALRATNAERQRIRDIEEMALPGSEQITNEAKYEKPMSASDYAKAAMKNAKEQGAAWLNTMQQGANASGVNSVGSAPAPTGGEKPDEFMDAIKGLGKKQ